MTLAIVILTRNEEINIVEVIEKFSRALQFCGVFFIFRLLKKFFSVNIFLAKKCEKKLEKVDKYCIIEIGE